MGVLIRGDAKQFRKYFNEMCKLIGQSAGYQYITSEIWTIHSENNAKFSAPIRIDLILNENPSIDTLTKLGWMTELLNQSPMLVRLPFNTPNLKVNCRIILESVDGTGRHRVFGISHITSDLEYPDCYTCALIPIYDQYLQDNKYTLVNNEKINQNGSPRTSKDQSSIYITGDYNIDTTPKENTEWANKYTFIDDNKSPYSG